MAFDPDAYLAEGGGVEATSFDPDAYLATTPQPVEEEGFLRQAADIPVNIFKGGVTGTRMVTDIFGAANPVSKALAGVEDYMDSLLSAEAKRDQQEIARILADAQDKGVLDQVMAGVEAFSVAPLDTLANAMGTMIPVLATGLAGSAARLAPVAVKGIQLGMGAAMGAGTVKGEIYNSVFSELQKQGLSVDAADKAASEAQAYGGKNLDQILVGAGLGAAAASTGAEKILTAVLSKQGKGVTGGLVQRVIKGGLQEAPFEGLQGGQEKLATNLALQREGFDVPTMRGVVSQATMEATAGLGAGGIAGVFGKVESEESREEKDIESDVNKVARELSAPAGDDNAKAIINETNRVEQKIQNNKEMLSAMEPTSSEHQRLSNEIAMDEKNLVALKQATEKVTGVSEPITSIEQQQAELAQAIAEEPAEVAPEVAPAEVPPVEAPAQVTEQVAPPTEQVAAPTEVVTPAAEVVTPPVSEPITEPTPAPTEPVVAEPTVTAPAEPAVGNRIRLGRSPQAYVIEEVIPQSEADQQSGKQFYSVKNQITGETQQIEASEFKMVQDRPVREALAEAVPTPEDKRLDYGDIAGEVVKLFGDGITAERLYVIDDVDRKVKASYDTSDGTIEINLAYVSKDDSIRDILAHELGHYIAGDKKLKAKFEEFLKSIPKKDRKILEDFVDEVYNKRTGEVRLEEKQVRAFVLRLGAGENRTKFQKLLDDIKKWFNENFGTKFKMTDRDAALILASAIDRFKSGEFIAREEEVGAMEMAAEVEKGKELGTLVGLAITREKTTPKNILSKTVNIIKKQVFDGDSEVTEGNTSKAWNLINKLEASNPDSTDNAEAINQLTRETMQEVKLSENATPEEVETLELIKETVGMPKLRNELYQYAIKMAGLGDKKMLSYLLNNKLNLTGKSVRTDSDLGRFLGALRGLSSWIITSTEAEQAGFFSVAAQQFFNTTNPTEEQIKQIQAMFEAVRKTKIDQEKELSAELEEVGKATGIDVAQKVVEAVESSVPARDPFSVAIDILRKEGAAVRLYKPPTMSERIKTALKPKLANYMKVMSEQGAKGLEATFWKTMSDKEDKPGPLAEVDAAINRNLAGIVKETLIKLGMKGEPPNTKMTLIEQVANILTNQKLTQEKMVLADKRVIEEINRREGIALERAGEDQDAIDAAEAEAQALRDAWNEAMGQQMNLPVSEATLGRLINNEMKEAGTKLSDIETLSELEPAIAETRKGTIVGQIVSKLGIKPEDANYDIVTKALSDKFNQMLEARKLKSRVAKAARDAQAELKRPDKQAESQIKRLAKIQSDTQEWATSKKDEVKAIVQNDLRNTPDMGRKEPWKAMLVGELKKAGVSDTQAGILADLVWNQHEKNALSREMDALNKAVEKGPIKGIVDAILNTPLAEQQKPEWRKEVIKKYLIDAGVPSTKADNIAKLFDISLQKRFAEAQVKAAEQAAKSIVGKLTPNSRRAFDRFIRAIRSQALAPDTDVAKAFGQQMGYRGFTAEEYARISELDQVINNEDTLDLERATAFKQIQNILSKASIPPRVRDAISSFYVAQALSGIPTATVNFFSPIGYALRYAMTDGMKTAIKNPSKLPTVFSAMLSSFKSYASEVAYSWNNNVQRRGVVEYLANDEKLLAVYNNGKKQWAEGNRAEGFKNMLFGSMEYVSRMLKALDEGALSVLEQQGLSRYAMAAMDAAGIKTSEQIAVANMVMKSKEEFILNSIAKGMNKRDAIAFSDDVYRSAWREALSDLKLDSQMVLDSAINDALSAVGRINITTDPLSGKEQKRVSDRGFASSIPISFLEAMSNAANAKTSNEIQRIFYRMMYGFAIVPARVMREAAWFSPYGFVRFAIDKGAKAKGYSSPYEQSLGTDVQRSQRFIEATAGTIVMLGAMAMAKSSVDDPEDELPFKIVFTGNGPDRRLDPQFFDTWRKKFKPNSINIFFGKTKFSINIERGFEAFAVPFMFAGAIDDWRIRKQFEKTKKSPKDLSDAAIILGSAFMSFNKRGPYSAFTNVYSSYKNSDNMIAEMAKQGAFYGKTFIPVIGSSLTRNVSDFINDPIDRTSLEGALYSNIPVLGPMMGTKSMNAVGQSQGATDFSDRLYKAGIPLVFSLPKNNQSEKINQLILKQGQGPTIPTRYNVRQRLGYEPTNKQYEVFVTTYGQYLAKKMTESHASLMDKKPVSYMKWLEKKSDTARTVATKAAKKIQP